MPSIHDTGRTDLHLIFPPQWSPFQPFLSTPSLKAYLEPKGHRVIQSDWNVGFYHYFIGRERLALAQRRLKHYVSVLSDEHAAYRGRAVYALAQLERYSELSRRVSKLKASRTCLHISEFKESVDAFNALLNAFSTAEPVIDVGTSSLAHPGVLSSFKALHHFIDNSNDNPFVDYFEQKLKNVRPPRFFGVSIIGGEQVVAGLTLCRVLKRTFPDVPIVIGGSVLSRLVEKDKWLRELFGTYFDFVCRYEGEQPMDAFLSSNDPKRDKTPNLAYIEDGGELVMSPLCEPLGMDDIPTPDYSDLAFAEYLSPHLVLPLLTTRGCYWGKCAFCYHGMIYQDRYRMRSAEMVARDVLRLHEQYGVRHFAFNDEALPPRLFKRLPQVIPPNRFFFTALYKFEKIFTPAVFREM